MIKSEVLKHSSRALRLCGNIFKMGSTNVSEGHLYKLHLHKLLNNGASSIASNDFNKIHTSSKM